SPRRHGRLTATRRRRTGPPPTATRSTPARRPEPVGTATAAAGSPTATRFPPVGRAAAARAPPPRAWRTRRGRPRRRTRDAASGAPASLLGPARRLGADRRGEDCQWSVAGATGLSAR